HLADELSGAEIAQHQLAAVVLLGDDAGRAVDHVIQGSGRVAGPEHVGPGRIAAAVAIPEEAVDGGGVRGQRVVAGLAVRSMQGSRHGGSGWRTGWPGRLVPWRGRGKP